MALVTALTAVLMMLAIGGSVALNTMTEATIAANHRDALQTLYAAEAAIELSISQLRTVTDWTAAAPDPRGTTLVQGTLAGLLQVTAIDPRLNVTALAIPDPNGDPNVLIVQAVATSAGGIRRSIQVTIRRAPASPSATTRNIETIFWRER
jgi:Tfp pilus assembly protein PilX